MTLLKAFSIYLAERRQEEGRQKAFWALQVAYGLSNVMDLMKKMGEDKAVWKDTSWSVVDKRFHVYRSTIFGRSFQQSTYFTPGRFRFGVCWQNDNPHSDFRNPEPIVAEARLDFENGDDSGKKVVLDVSVRQCKAAEGRKNGNRYMTYLRGEVDLTDFVFGADKHHILLASGQPDDCLELIKNTMAFLHVSRLYKTTDEIPISSLKW